MYNSFSACFVIKSYLLSYVKHIYSHTVLSYILSEYLSRSTPELPVLFLNSCHFLSSRSLIPRAVHI